jgi:hypothetical protein
VCYDFLIIISAFGAPSLVKTTYFVVLYCVAKLQSPVKRQKNVKLSLSLN